MFDRLVVGRLFEPTSDRRRRGPDLRFADGTSENGYRNRPGFRTRLALAATSLWLTACSAGVAWAWATGRAKGADVAFQLAGAAPLLAWLAAIARGRIPRDSVSPRALLLAATLPRLVLLPFAPGQSDDAYRYAWEGRIQLAGRNPYALAPLDDRLAPLRDADWERINHPEHSAIYPPLAQIAFAATAAIAPGVAGLKAVMLAFDLIALAALMRLLGALGLARERAVVWAFHPLPIVEFAGNGHLDAAMIAFLVLAFAERERGREGRATAALAASVGLKLVPIALLPFFARGAARGQARGETGGRADALRRAALFALVPLSTIALYALYAGAGVEGLARSLWVYQRDWLYNAPAFEAARDGLFGADGFLARRWLYGTILAVAAAAAVARASPLAAAAWIFGILYAAGPVIHPWYLTLLLPIAAARRGAWPWLWATLAAPAVYWADAAPERETAVRALVWAPFFAGAAAEAMRGLVVRVRERMRGRSVFR